MVIMRFGLLFLCLCAVMPAGEATLELPDPVIPGVAMEGTLRVVDPPSDVQAVDLPSVDGLEIQMSGQNGSQTSITNGARSTVITVGLILRASQRGQLSVPELTVRLADGSTMKTAPQTLRVDNGDARLTGNATAEVSFDPPSIVPGQTTKLVYRITLRRGEVHTLGIGPPDGSILLGERTITSARTFDAAGKPWTATTIVWPMTASTAGSLVVRGQQEYQQVVGSSGFDQRVTRHQIAVAAATLTVEPMPTTGRPDGFAGLIGPLAATAALERERVSAGEGTVLTLSVISRQSDLIKRPTLVVSGAQLYAKDDSTSDGTRHFRWDVVPAAAGSITIPSVAFAYFDPGSRSYRSAATQELRLDVIPGRSRDLGIVGVALPAASAAAQAVPAGPVLPAPKRGGVIPNPPVWGTLAALVGGLLIGLTVPLVQLMRRSRRGPHRGRALRSAGRDLQGLEVALRQLRPLLTTEAQRTAAEALQAAIERCRFGGEALPDIAAWVAELEGVA